MNAFEFAQQFLAAIAVNSDATNNPEVWIKAPNRDPELHPIKQVLIRDGYLIIETKERRHVR